MRKITDILKEKNRTFSFELFPPKTPEGHEKLLWTIGQLAALKPDFMSVTYGAGGGNREKTIDIVELIQKKYKIIGVAHLTCVIHTKEEIKAILEEIKRRGINNVLALRGDPPKDFPDWQPTEKNFKYSSQLCAFIRKEFGDYFSIGVAGFPQGHIMAPNKEADAKFLKAKIDAGADYVITQLFFENKDYFDYVARLKALGITNRIIPGILPVTDYNGVVRFCQNCGTTVPKKIHDTFAPIQEDKEAVLQEGIKFATAQCQELLKGGAPGLHFYTLNRFEPVNSILKNIKI